MIPILIGVVVVALFTPFIAWLVSRWADREQQADEQRTRARMEALMHLTNTPPRAAGLKSSHRRVS